MVHAFYEAALAGGPDNGAPERHASTTLATTPRSVLDPDGVFTGPRSRGHVLTTNNRRVAGPAYTSGSSVAYVGLAYVIAGCGRDHRLGSRRARSATALAATAGSARSAARSRPAPQGRG